MPLGICPHHPFRLTGSSSDYSEANMNAKEAMTAGRRVGSRGSPPVAVQRRGCLWQTAWDASVDPESIQGTFDQVGRASLCRVACALQPHPREERWPGSSRDSGARTGVCTSTSSPRGEVAWVFEGLRGTRWRVHCNLIPERRGGLSL